jgi:hypothetical protein
MTQGKFDKDIDKLVEVLPMQVVEHFLLGEDAKTDIFAYWTSSTVSFRELLRMWVK